MEKKTQGSFRNRERKNRSEMHKSSKNSDVHPFERFRVEHREEVDEKILRYLSHLLWG